jgi:transposase
MIATNKLYVGIDIHKKEQIVSMLPSSMLHNQPDNWKKTKPLIIRNHISDYELLDSTIKNQLQDIGQISIAVDHTGGYYSAPITHFLSSRGYTIFYLTSQSVKAAKERFLKEENKTDKIDSAVIAYLLYLRDSLGLSLNISATVPNMESKAALLKSLILQRMQYVRLATQATNRLHQYLLAVFPEGEIEYFRQLLKIVPYYPIPIDMINSDGLKDINGITNDKRSSILALARKTVGVPGEQYRWIIKDLSTQRAEALHKSSSISWIIKKEVKKHLYGEILFSFPYIGEVISATLIGIIKDINHWPSKNKLKKALGVYGREYISGAGQTIKRPGKGGSRDGKRVLFQACFSCIRKSAPPNDFKDYYEKQRSHGKIFVKAISSTTGKMVEIIYHCLKLGEKYQYQGKYRLH